MKTLCDGGEGGLNTNGRPRAAHQLKSMLPRADMNFIFYSLEWTKNFV